MMDPEYPNHHRDLLHEYYYVKALAALLQDEDARQYIANMRAFIEDLNPDLVQYFEPLAIALEGIATHDTEQLHEAIEQLVEYHAADIADQPSSAQEYVCLPALALSKLAERHGLEVDIESEYIPQEL